MKISLACIVFAGMVFTIGCRDAAPGRTTEAASWQYVREAWGGAHIGEPDLADDTVTIPLALEPDRATRVDSAICTCGASASLEERRVLISIQKCLCGTADHGELTVLISRPLEGDYEIVYDDPAADFPHLGVMRVP